MKIYKVIIVALCALFFFGCSATQKTASPTEILKTFIEASQKKDVEVIKKSLSKGSLDLIEKSAEAENTSVDEFLKKDNGMPAKEMPETRNEKVEGDTASVEVKNLVTGGFDAIPFIKEDGNWKIALDKYIEDIKKKMAEDMKIAPTEDESDSNASKSDSEKQDAPNKSKADK
jgi:PBP1b-binding outer membrane lipoprotein LpoB